MPIKTYLINKINSQRHRINGLLPSRRLPIKRNLCRAFRDNMLYAPQQLPPKVDLRKDMTTVENQSQVGSCAANALAGAYEYLTKKDNGKNTDVSRLFIYYNARVKEKTGSVTDSGCSMASAIEALEELGTCLESTWPYDISKVNTRPNDQAYRDAKSHTISEALEISINLIEMKSCLAQGYPFAFGLRLFSSFDKAATTGLVPMPDTSGSYRKSHGCHALLAVGYSDLSKAFIVRNSWGEKWGDKGYCYIPYEYMTNAKLCFDAWAIRKLSNTNFGQEYWDTNDTVNYQNICTSSYSYNDNDNNLEILDVDENDGNNPANYPYGMNYPMNGNNFLDNYQQQYATGGYQTNLGSNQYNQPNWNNNQSDQPPMFDNQFNQQNCNPNQFQSQPDQQSWNNQNFQPYNNDNNSYGQQNWYPNQFDQQQNWNNSQIHGEQQNQFQQPTWQPSQFDITNFNSYQPDLTNQQYGNNSNIYPANHGNTSFGQDMGMNNQWNQQNQPYGGKIIKSKYLTVNTFQMTNV